MTMSYVTCMRCGKSLVDLVDPNNQTQSDLFVERYLMGTKSICIECKNGKSARNEKVGISHTEDWDFRYLI
jgi:hypothetical protein